MTRHNPNRAPTRTLHVMSAGVPSPAKAKVIGVTDQVRRSTSGPRPEDINFDKLHSKSPRSCYTEPHAPLRLPFLCLPMPSAF
jgi:hypothetical protein